MPLRNRETKDPKSIVWRTIDTSGSLCPHEHPVLWLEGRIKWLETMHSMNPKNFYSKHFDPQVLLQANPYAQPMFHLLFWVT